jgi:hypothetical protein
LRVDQAMLLAATGSLWNRAFRNYSQGDQCGLLDFWWAAVPEYPHNVTYVSGTNQMSPVYTRNYYRGKVSNEAFTLLFDKKASCIGCSQRRGGRDVMVTGVILNLHNLCSVKTLHKCTICERESIWSVLPSGRRHGATLS